MINLRIDGLEIAAEAGMTILEAAKTAGIEIRKGAWNPYSYTLLPGKN